MSTHPTEEQIRDFVMGVDSGLSPMVIKTHLASCETCAAIAAREAALEHALWEVRQQLEPCPGCGTLFGSDEPPARCEYCGVAHRPGGFRVREVLVTADRSRLYLAENAAGRRVALKEMVFTKVPDLATIEAFEREARLLKQLDHPRIPSFILK